MKVSDAISDYISKKGTSRIFGVSGGASLHLLDSVNRHPGLTLVCVHHEQTVAMAAESYSRLSSEVGVGIVTSGPGATNLITGIAGAYFDSIPCVFITGQVSTTRMKGNLGVRQVGFQETPIVDIAKPVTKFAFTVLTPEEVLPTLNKAWALAISGRPGPVLIDIPDDIQRMEIKVPWRNLTEHTLVMNDSQSHANEIVEQLLELLGSSHKPIIICGAGIRSSNNSDNVVRRIVQANIPVALTWGAKDLFPASDKMVLGTFGTHGNRVANTVLNSSDLIISVGSRLDLKATGSPVASFAPHAKKIMIDIDSSEIHKFEKFGMKIDLPICLDISSPEFDILLERLASFDFQVEPWKSEILALKSTMPHEPRRFNNFGINPYEFINQLSKLAPGDSNVVIDTGCAVAWTMQEWLVKNGQRLIHDFNNTAMGWSIPAAIASALISTERLTICLVGDGSLMMAQHDLSTLSVSKGPVCIFLLNNGGYSMIKQTQDQWFDGDYFASSSNVDLHFTDFELLARANNFGYRRIENADEMVTQITSILEEQGLIFCEVIIQSDARVLPIVKFGKPNHQMDPELQ